MYSKFVISLACLIAGMTAATLAYTQDTNSKVINKWDNSRYTLSDKHTVTDGITKLMWKRCSEGQSSGSCTGTASQSTWKEALELANGSSFAGHSDWRLPNIKELRSLVAYNRSNPAINLYVFPGTSAMHYWTSSPYEGGSTSTTTNAWTINFSGGQDESKSRTDDTHYVRLVRDAN